MTAFYSFVAMRHAHFHAHAHAHAHSGVCICTSATLVQVTSVIISKPTRSEECRLHIYGGALLRVRTYYTYYGTAINS